MNIHVYLEEKKKKTKCEYESKHYFQFQCEYESNKIIECFLTYVSQ